MAELQKELKTRRRIESIYNKRQEDFASLREYGDYEEEKEDIIFNLSQGIDVKAMEDKIAAYQKQNYNEILRNEAQKAESRRLKIEEKAPKPQQGSLEPPQQSSDQPDRAGAIVKPHILPPVPITADSDKHVNEETSQVEPEGQLDSREAMGVVSGWSPEMPKKRAIEEAYCTLFLV